MLFLCRWSIPRQVWKKYLNAIPSSIRYAFLNTLNKLPLYAYSSTKYTFYLSSKKWYSLQIFGCTIFFYIFISRFKLSTVQYLKIYAFYIYKHKQHVKNVIHFFLKFFFYYFNCNSFPSLSICCQSYCPIWTLS